MILEMTPDEVEGFLHEQMIGRLGCHVDGSTYVVPVIYAWDGTCAYVYSIEGRKVQMMRQNPTVCFEVDEYLNGGGWRSVIIQGTYEELSGSEAVRTLHLLSERFVRHPSRHDGQRPRAEGRQPVAFRIRAAEVTGRKVNRSLEASAKGRAGRFLARRAGRRPSLQLLQGRRTSARR